MNILTMSGENPTKKPTSLGTIRPFILRFLSKIESRTLALHGRHRGFVSLFGCDERGAQRRFENLILTESICFQLVDVALGDAGSVGPHADHERVQSRFDDS